MRNVKDYGKSFRKEAVERMKEYIANGISLSNAVKRMKKEPTYKDIPYETIRRWYYNAVPIEGRKALKEKAEKTQIFVDKALGLKQEVNPPGVDKSTTKEDKVSGNGFMSLMKRFLDWLGL